jgi:hypothetical protein
MPQIDLQALLSAEVTKALQQYTDSLEEAVWESTRDPSLGGVHVEFFYPTREPTQDSFQFMKWRWRHDPDIPWYEVHEHQVAPDTF